MRSSTRHQLKTDEFRETTVTTLNWAVENQPKLVAAAVVAAIILAVVIGGYAYVNYRNQQARGTLAAAIDKYNAPIRPAGQPAVPGEPSYASAVDRAKAANAEFTEIANKYSFTESGRIARYFEGITLRDMGNTAAAEKQLSEVASGWDKSMAGLAKLALAGLYVDTNQTAKAIDMYKQLIDHPASSVGKWTPQFELADLYTANNQPQDARKLYEQLQKESPTTPIGQMATQKLQALGPAAAAQPTQQ
ncbi:MAG: tetratricopeptide repeat protein [Acidobacteriota bacterium]|nr:tetratricopeptide repeat protein [Acidobacteriota bacterium]